MVMWYNLTSINATNVLTFTQGINQTFMFNWLGTLILVVLFFISFISMNYYWQDTQLNFTISCFFVGVISFFLVILKLTYNYIPFLFWGLFAIGIMTMLLSRR